MGFVMTALAKTGGVVPSEGPLMRRRSVMTQGEGWQIRLDVRDALMRLRRRGCQEPSAKSLAG